MFDPFVTTKRPGKGTGLGLSVSYRIIKSHNGEIAAYTDKKGATFEITLPVYPVRDNPPEADDGRLRRPISNGVKEEQKNGN